MPKLRDRSAWHMLAVLLLWACLVPHEVARAQVSPLGPGPTREAVRHLRLAHRAEQRREGLVLLGEGALTGLGGAALAASYRDDPRVLSLALTTSVFGLSNALLALGLLDLRQTRERAIVADATAPFDSARRAEAAQLRSGQIFALNTGLDVAYITAGALLVAFARGHSNKDELARGAGVAMLGNAAFLLGFDVACWLRANRRAAAYLGL